MRCVGVIALGILANEAQVGDLTIDGRIFPVSDTPSKPEKRAGHTAVFSEFLDRWYPIQVKQTDKARRPDIDAFETAMERPERTKGFFVAFGYTSEAETECAAFHKKSGRIIKLIPVRETLDEQHVQKM